MQSKWESIAESATSTAAGFTIAIATNYYVFGSAMKATGLTLFLTVVSYVNKYYVRRFFNWREYRRGLNTGN